MRRILLYTVMSLLLVDLSAGVVSAAKLKHRRTVYDDGAELALRYPEGVGCAEGVFVVADTGNSRIVRYALTAQALKAEAVLPLPNASPLVAQIAADGAIYVLDGRTRTILKMTAQGQVLGRVEPTGLPASQKVVPRSFKLGPGGNLYLLDIFSERVLVLDPAEEFVRQLAFPEPYGFFSDLAIGPQGAVYLLDSVEGTIYSAHSGAEQFEVFSTGLKEYVNFPISLALDENGVVYLSDQYGSGLAQVGRDGSFQGRKFGMGWEEGQLYYPAQLCISAQGSLIIADRSNSRVQVFDLLDE